MKISVKQKLFNTSLKWIRKQGGPSMGNPLNGIGLLRCKYNGDNGRGCAARPFILSPLKPEYEMGWSCLVERHRDRGSKLWGLVLLSEAEKEYMFVQGLQQAHDSAAIEVRGKLRVDEEFMESYEFNMKKFAKTKKLVYTPPTEEIPDEGCFPFPNC